MEVAQSFLLNMLLNVLLVFGTYLDETKSLAVGNLGKMGSRLLCGGLVEPSKGRKAQR